MKASIQVKSARGNRNGHIAWIIIFCLYCSLSSCATLVPRIPSAMSAKKCISTGSTNMTLNIEVQQRLREFEHLGFFAIDSNKWTDKERRAIDVAMRDFCATAFYINNDLICRVSVKPYENDSLVAIVWICVDLQGQPLAAVAGGSLYTVIVSADGRLVKRFSGA